MCSLLGFWRKIFQVFKSKFFNFSISGRSILRGSHSANIDNSQLAQSLPTSSFLLPKPKQFASGRRTRTRSQSFSDSDDVMFPIEGFHEDNEDCKPFAESDDDSSGGESKFMKMKKNSSCLHYLCV